MQVNGIEVKGGDVWRVRSADVDSATVLAVDGDMAWLKVGPGHWLQAPALFCLLRRSGETEDRDRTRWQYSDEPGWNDALHGDPVPYSTVGGATVYRAPRVPPAKPRRMAANLYAIGAEAHIREHDENWNCDLFKCVPVKTPAPKPRRMICCGPKCHKFGNSTCHHGVEHDERFGCKIGDKLYDCHCDGIACKPVSSPPPPERQAWPVRKQLTGSLWAWSTDTETVFPVTGRGWNDYTIVGFARADEGRTEFLRSGVIEVSDPIYWDIRQNKRRPCKWALVEKMA